MKTESKIEKYLVNEKSNIKDASKALEREIERELATSLFGDMREYPNEYFGDLDKNDRIKVLYMAFKNINVKSFEKYIR